MKHPTFSQAREPKNLWRTRYGVGLLVLASVAAFFLFAEHRAHIFGALPLLLVLACPLMHLFMHRGHGAHGHRANSEQPRIAPDESNLPNQESRHEPR